ncbi:MAG TPA: methyltransferase [Myxococcales bacterium]
MFETKAIEALLHQAYIAVEGTGLRDEERKKAVEIAALLGELARTRKRGHLVDAAAGKAYVGVLAARLVGYGQVTVIERDAARAQASREAAKRLGVAERVKVVQGDVGDPGCWPRKPDLVAALHACGPASDSIIDAAIANEARWLLLVPCCYGAQVPFAKLAEEKAEEAGMARHPEVRRRLVAGLVDAERTLRLEAAGWQTTVAPFVPPTVTPHNLLWRARRSREAGRMAEAAAALGRLRG